MSSMPRLNNVALQYSDRWGGITDEVRRIDLTLTTAPDEVADKCKTLCEMVLKSIIIFARSKTEDECESIDMEGLKALVCQSLNFSEVEKDLIKAEITFLARLRNFRGTAGHGRSLQRQRELRESVDEKENERLLSITDSLLPHLIDKFEMQYPQPKEAFIRNDTFDVYIDTFFGKIKIYDAEYAASDILHELDPVAYKTALNGFSESDNGEEEQ